VFGIAGRTPCLPDDVVDYSNNGVIGNPPLARAIVINYVA
jgi:hypothetical protein